MNIHYCLVNILYVLLLYIGEVRNTAMKCGIVALKMSLIVWRSYRIMQLNLYYLKDVTFHRQLLEKFLVCQPYNADINIIYFVTPSNQSIVYIRHTYLTYYRGLEFFRKDTLGPADLSTVERLPINFVYLTLSCSSAMDSRLQWKIEIGVYIYTMKRLQTGFTVYHFACRVALSVHRYGLYISAILLYLVSITQDEFVYILKIPQHTMHHTDWLNRKIMFHCHFVIYWYVVKSFHKLMDLILYPFAFDPPPSIIHRVLLFNFNFRNIQFCSVYALSIS